MKDYYAALKSKPVLPKVLKGAEVYYFPRMANCEELRPMALTGIKLLLVEPPMTPYTNHMLDEIEAIGRNLSLQPVLAHLDRYCRMLDAPVLFEAVGRGEIFIQVNASFSSTDSGETLHCACWQKEESTCWGQTATTQRSGHPI